MEPGAWIYEALWECQPFGGALQGGLSTLPTCEARALDETWRTGKQAVPSRRPHCHSSSKRLSVEPQRGDCRRAPVRLQICRHDAPFSLVVWAVTGDQRAHVSPYRQPAVLLVFHRGPCRAEARVLTGASHRPAKRCSSDLGACESVRLLRSPAPHLPAKMLIQRFVLWPDRRRVSAGRGRLARRSALVA